MIASVHIADVGARAALKVLRRAPRSTAVQGLLHVDVALAAPLSPSVVPWPSFGRVALIAFWDDDVAVDRFVAEHPLAAVLAGGWQVRMEPLRAFGAWPGLPDDVPDRACGRPRRPCGGAHARTAAAHPVGAFPSARAPRPRRGSSVRPA